MQEKKTALGLTGEKIVRNFFTKKGFIVTDTVNVYDSDKDFDAEYKGKTYSVEVKTQVPFVSKNSVTIKDNQYKKCFSVDILIFVVVPPNKPFEYGGKIFKIDTKSVTTENHTTKDGRNMILIPLKQSAVKQIATLAGNEISLLKKNISTDY